MVESALELPEGTLKPNTRLETLAEWDSIAKLTFMSVVDEELNVAVKGKDVVEAATVADLAALVGIH